MRRAGCIRRAGARGLLAALVAFSTALLPGVASSELASDDSPWSAVEREEPWPGFDVPAPAPPLTLTGTVQPLGGRGSGGAAGVRIVSPASGAWEVEGRGKGMDLEDYVGRIVTVVGVVKHEDGRDVLAVSGYEVH